MLSGIESTLYLRLPGVLKLDRFRTPGSAWNMRITVFADSPHSVASSLAR